LHRFNDVHRDRIVGAAEVKAGRARDRGRRFEFEFHLRWMKTHDRIRPKIRPGQKRVTPTEAVTGDRPFSIALR
jgi:hypothetical protein